MDILETQLMQRTVSLVAVMPMAPSLRFATLRQDSVNADLMFRASGVMNASPKPLACSRQEDAFPATVTPLGLNHSIVKRVVNVGASLG